MSQTHTPKKSDGGGLSESKGGYFSLFGRFGFGRGKSELSQPEKQTQGSKGDTVTYHPDYSKPPTQIDWVALDAMTEEELQAAIDSDPDCPEMTDEEWAKAVKDAGLG